MTIYCTGCEVEVVARLTDGAEIYPHRSDLSKLPFWKCDTCNNYVGCHHKTDNPTNPLGNIPTPELRKARSQIHAILDPMWRNGSRTRKEIYKDLSDKLGWSYHTAKLKSLKEANQVLAKLKENK